MITREHLESGAYLASFKNTDDLTWWTREQIAASLEETLARRPDPGAPVWLFAYGSLIWNPAFLFAEQQHATLHGWQRSFCMRLVAGRGTPQHPGRMLALDACPTATPPGRFTEPRPTHTSGIAYRLDEDQLRHELMLVWIREMIGGTYRPLWQEARLADGRTAQTLIFAMDEGCAFYERDSTIATVAPIIATASGHLGHNIDYLLSLDESLRQHGIQDPYITDIVSAVQVFASDI